MKPWFAIAALLAGSSAASAQTADPIPTLSSSGAGQYEVWRKVTPTLGEEATRYLQPGRDSLPLSKVRRAECSYKANSAGPLTLKLIGAEWNCPFAKSTEAACEVTYAAAAFGGIDLKRKGH